jgi:hypothetical protein
LVVSSSLAPSSQGPQYSSFQGSPHASPHIHLLPSALAPDADAQSYTTITIVTHTQSPVDLVTPDPAYQLDPTKTAIDAAAATAGGETPDPPDPAPLPQTGVPLQVDSLPQGGAPTREDNPAQTGSPARGGSNPDPVGEQALTDGPTIDNGQPGTAGPIAVAGQLVTPVASSGFIAGGQTLAPGATGIINGVSMSVGNGYIVVGDQTASAVANGPATATLTGGIPVSVGPNGVIQVGQESATVGEISVAQGTPITVQCVGVTPLASGAIVVNGVTVSAGGVRTLPNGQIASLGQDSSVVVVNGYTAILAMPGIVNNPSAITVNGALITPFPNGAVVIEGTTVMPGNIITLSNGKTLSVAPGGSAVVINSQTQAITRSSGLLITPGPNVRVVVGSRTLSAGQIATLPNGQVMSVGTSGTFVINGTTTSFRSVSGVSSISGRNSATSKTTSTQSTRGPGDAIALGVGATKKSDADILYTGQNRDVNAGFGLVLALVALLAGV